MPPGSPRMSHLETEGRLAVMPTTCARSRFAHSEGSMAQIEVRGVTLYAVSHPESGRSTAVSQDVGIPCGSVFNEPSSTIGCVPLLVLVVCDAMESGCRVVCGVVCDRQCSRRRTSQGRRAINRSRTFRPEPISEVGFLQPIQAGRPPLHPVKCSC